MAQSIQAISQHALERFDARSGVNFKDAEDALNRLWKVIQAARFQGTKGDAAIWVSKGWKMVVNKRTVQTMYLQETVKRHKELRRYE